MTRIRVASVWLTLTALVTIPLIAAAFSPLLQWRDPVYIAAGFAGVTALALLLIQPLLAAALLPGITPQNSRRLHRRVGAALVLSIVIHIAGLWVTSPPDVVDALLLVSPTPFSAWGVAAMWAVLTISALVAFRHKLGMSPTAWRTAHKTLALIIVSGSVVHAMLIEGTMETLSKSALCALVLAAALAALIRTRRTHK